MKHDEYLEEARQAIQELYGDTSVGIEKTRQSLNTLMLEIKDIIYTLDEEIRAKNSPR